MKCAFIFILSIYCASLIASVDNASPMWGEFKDEKEYTDNVNNWLQESQIIRLESLETKKKIVVALNVALVVVLLTITIMSIKSGSGLSKVAYRLAAWFPLYLIAWAYIYPSIFVLTIIFLPTHVALWFQRKLSRKELIFSGATFLLGLVALLMYYFLLAGLASQGAGQ